MQFRTEIDIDRLQHAWDGRESAGLRFTQIKKAMGWNSGKAARILKRAVEEGYVEKIQRDGAAVYRSRLTDYRGYFDAFEFLREVDELCRKNNKFQSVEQHLYSYLPFHILAYGVPPIEKLTPLEDELLFTLFARMSAAFFDYVRFCNAVDERQEMEKTEVLPEAVKSNLFVPDEGHVPLSIRAAQVLYGDVLWEHIFHKIVNDIRFALTKGSLDMTGPIQLQNSHNRFVDLAMRIAKDVCEGKLSEHSEPDPVTVERIQRLYKPERYFQPHLSNVGIVLTQSPRTMEKYNQQIGSMIKDAFRTWSSRSVPGLRLCSKADNLWEDLFLIRDAKISRRELLRISLIDKLSTMRASRERPIDKNEEKLMLKDPVLHQAFSKEEIRNIIESVGSLLRRARKFNLLSRKGTSLDQMKKDPDWFSEHELRYYELADGIETQIRWQEALGTSGPVTVKLPIYPERMKELVNAYRKKVRAELRKATLTSAKKSA